MRSLSLLLGASVCAHGVVVSYLGPSTRLTAHSTVVGAPALGSPGDIDDPGGPFAVPLGIGFDGTVSVIVTRTNGAVLCSGAMIAPNAMLGAAHCFTDTSGANITMNVDVTAFPSFGGSVTKSAPGTSVFIPTLYDGSTISSHDIAIVLLNEAFTAGIDFYNTFTALEAPTNATYTTVGFGMRGAGATGATLGAGSRRRGYNNADLMSGSAVLLADFDNGLAAQDTACLVPANVCDLGLGALEATLGGGDSGGPVFVGGRIMAVNSFIARANVGDLDGALNSTFGEFSGMVFTGFHETWIRNVIAVPEPGTSLLLMAGCLAGALRRYAASSRR